MITIERIEISGENTFNYFIRIEIGGEALQKVLNFKNEEADLDLKQMKKLIKEKLQPEIEQKKMMMNKLKKLQENQVGKDIE